VELTIKAPDLGEVQAKTTIPDSFHITSFTGGRFAPSNSPADPWIPLPIQVEWTPSEGAYGYLVDLVVYKLNFEEFDTLYEEHQSPTDYLIEERILLPDLVTFPNIKYEKIPILFKTLSGSKQRGVLTQETSIEIPFEGCKNEINQDQLRFDYCDFSGCLLTLYKESLYFQVDIYALDEALYNYTTIQYLKLGDERVVGQRTTIPDISNVEGGVGVVGATYCWHSPILQFWWDKAVYYGIDKYDKLVHYKPADGPKLFAPEDNRVIDLSDAVTFSWGEIFVEQFDYPLNNLASLPVDYVLYFQPRYMSFRPAQMALIVDTTFTTIRPFDFPVRDCTLSWYVKGVVVFESFYREWLSHRPEIPTGINYSPLWQVILSPAENYDFFNGIYYVQSVDFQEPGSGVKAQVTPFRYLVSMASDTRTLVIPSGHVNGFEQQKVHLLAAKDDAVFGAGDSLRWSPVDGADVYLLYFESKSGKAFSTVSFSNSTAPPFQKLDYIEGLGVLEKFPSGSEWRWSVCALRLESGMMGFVVNQTKDLPTASPRYKHPRGIFQQSEWGSSSFQIQ